MITDKVNSQMIDDFAWRGSLSLTGHPRFFNQLSTGLDIVGLAGEWLTSTANTNMWVFSHTKVTFQSIYVNVLMEIQLTWKVIESHRGISVWPLNWNENIISNQRVVIAIIGRVSDIITVFLFWPKKVPLTVCQSPRKMDTKEDVYRATPPAVQSMLVSARLWSHNSALQGN